MQQREEIQRLYEKAALTKARLHVPNALDDFLRDVLWLNQVSSGKDYGKYTEYVNEVFTFTLMCIESRRIT